MVMKLAILSIWLQPTLGVQRLVSNHTFLSSPTDKAPLTPKNGVPVLNFLFSSECALVATLTFKLHQSSRRTSISTGQYSRLGFHRPYLHLYTEG